VTGAGGFAGRHLVDHLLAMGDEVVASDTTTPSEPEPRTGIEHVVLDVTDEQACWELLGEWRPDVVYHLAGIAHVSRAEQEPERCLAVNRDGCRNMLNSCIDGFANVRVLFVSTAEVYGPVVQEAMPVHEDHPLRPATVYALSKAQAEMAVHLAVARGLHAVIARAFNHIGPGQSDDFVTAAFAHQIARIEAGLQDPVMHVGNLDAVRDFSDVRDTVAAYRLCLLHGQPGEVLNVTSGQAVSIRRILDALISMSTAEVSVEQDPSRLRPVDVPVFHGSYERLRERCGHAPERALEDTLRGVLDYWRASVAMGSER
jgi:GDP-4-dehydro-6-deoxy-D-mannose reductase